MNFELVTLDGVKFQAQAYSVILPTAAGQITVLPGHEPLLALLVPGVIVIRRNKGDAEHHLEHFATYGGVVEIGHDGARVLVDEATPGADISETEAQKAHDAAVAMRASAKNQVELDRAQTLVDRQTVRLDLAKIKRHHTRNRG